MNDALGFRRRFVLVDLGTVPTVVVNGSAPMLVLLIAALQFFAFPLVPPTRSAAVSLVALAVLSAPLHWGLMHETIHGRFRRAPLEPLGRARLAC
jgi:hypothetical protein